MKRLEADVLCEVRGGAISGSLINSFVRGIESILDLGRSLGTAIRRIGSNAICKI